MVIEWQFVTEAHKKEVQNEYQLKVTATLNWTKHDVLTLCDFRYK